MAPCQNKAVSGDKSNVSFVEEIQLMMYGLGDSPQPSAHTAELLEKVILKQLLAIIAQAKCVASMRSRDSIQPEDILFMMRKNTVGLKRLLVYLAVKDEKQTLHKNYNVGENDKINDEMITDRVREDPNPATWKSSRKNYCLNQLRLIGIDEADIINVEDSVKKERLLRADGIAQSLPPSAYEDYQRARQVSFGAGLVNPKKFLQWLKEGGLTVVVLPPVSEILVYLAKETLSQIISMVLTLREQSPNRHTGNQREPSVITVKEVREVVRRCWTPQSFVLGILTRDLPPYCDSKLMAI